MPLRAVSPPGAGYTWDDLRRLADPPASSQVARVGWGTAVTVGKAVGTSRPMLVQSIDTGD